MLRLLQSRTTRHQGFSRVLVLLTYPQELLLQQMPQFYMHNGQADSEATSTPKLVLHEPFLAKTHAVITHMEVPSIHVGHGDGGM